ncbi:allantoin permease [Streptomyces sp. NP160]|uniref:purine-cytosine permease family protein n=1 Tax=Streptomyces sp. NP160 TaxID=2586637 RepID=UPI001118BC63|nr:cytosine permease [Streptomyces sp. NP160]TNM64094.1 allantoin permease [Streptomyces sp. NP160]
MTSSRSSGGAGGPLVEQRSIDWVPARERHGKVALQGPFWFMGNFQPFTLAIGLIGPGVGLSLGWSAVAGIAGILFGTLFMAFHATQGAHLGLPQMVQSRAQFGYRGVLVPLFGSLVTFVAFNIVDTVIIGTGLESLFGWDHVLVGVVVGVVGAVLAIFGHDWLHLAFRWLFWVSLPFWVVLTVGVLVGAAGGDGAAASGAAEPLGFSGTGFLVLFTVAAGYNITYAPYVSDYSRYLPEDTPPTKIIASVFWGAAASPAWLIPLGAWFATNLGVTDALTGIHDAGNAVVPLLGTVLVVVSVLALVATMGLNAYSGMLSLVTAADSLRTVPRTRGVRVVAIVVLAVVWTALGTALTDASQAVTNALILMLYLLAPWTAINLVDYFFVRRGRYAVTDLFTPDGIYGRWGVRGLVAYGVGVLAELPFVSVPGVVTAPVAGALDGADFAPLVGLLVPAVVYLLLSRGVDLRAEQAAVERSRAELARSEVPAR